MIDTELLLRHTPEDAIVMMVNAENGTHFPSGTFDIGEPVVVSGRQTQIHLKVRKSRHRDDEVPYEGEFDLTYNRLQMQDHFQDVLTGWNVTLPTSTRIVLNELKRRLGQDFFIDDVVLEEIGRNNASPYILKAKAESLRWVGQLEIWLAEYKDLTDFFNSAILSNSDTRMGSLDATPQLISTQINAAFSNATAYPQLIANLVEGNYAQDQTSLTTLVQKTVAAPGQDLSVVSPWVMQSTPAPFNLYNARMLLEPVAETGINPVNHELTHCIRVLLDLTKCTNINDPEVLIPYRVDDFSSSTFNREPRLSRYGVKSLTNGTAFNMYLNGLAVGAQITSLALAGGPFFINGPIAYVANPVTAGPRNLYGSTVIYNGQVRSIDPKPADPTLNRVVILSLSAKNTAYRGNFAIHYRAPIVLPATIPTAQLNMPYNFNFNATHGTAPYTYVKYNGNFAPGQVLSNEGVLSGPASLPGTYRVGVDVSDAAGRTVRYFYEYNVTVAPLLVTGNAPDPVVGQPFSFRYTITGGVAPYTNLILNGLPAGLTFNTELAEIQGTAQVEAEGPDSWVLYVKDVVNTEIFRPDSVDVRPAP